MNCTALDCTAQHCTVILFSGMQGIASDKGMCSTVQCSTVQSITVQYSAVQCSTVQDRTVQCSAVQCSAVQCSAVQCSAVQCSAGQCSAVQCTAVQCSAVQCSSALYTELGVQLVTVDQRYSPSSRPQSDKYQYIVIFMHIPIPHTGVRPTTNYFFIC